MSLQSRSLPVRPARRRCPAVVCAPAVLTFLAALLLPGAAAAAPPAQEPSPGDALPDGGIPVTSDLVHRACGSCHPSDDQRRMSRISYQRTTPEGWQQTVRRMVLLNDLEIEAADAREAVRYLATHHGLAPEEARLGAFEVERRNVDFYYEADPRTQETCNRCHSMGRVLNQRRTTEEWELLVAMHRGYYPFSDFQSFTRGGRADPPGRTPMHRLTAVRRSNGPWRTSPRRSRSTPPSGRAGRPTCAPRAWKARGRWSGASGARVQSTVRSS